MRTKNIAVVVLAALLLVVGWQRLVLGPMGSSESKANRVTEEERTRARSLDAEIRRLKGDGEGSKGPSPAELRAAIPESPAVSSFLRSVDAIRQSSGVTLQAITPSPVAAGGGAPSIGVDISVQGSWQQVRAYLIELVNLDRLVVIDNVALTPGAAAASGTAGAAPVAGGPVGDVFAGPGSAPTMAMQLTGRIFTEQAPAGAVDAAGGAAAG